MVRVLSDKRPKARKHYNCDACEWLLNAGINGMGYTFAEIRSIAKAKKAKWKIVKGQKYIKQTGIHEGEITIFRAIPEINDICLKYDLYRE